MKLMRLVAAIAAPLLLSACLLQPGKFTSDLTVRADRSFTFAYKGEVYALDPSSSMASSLGGTPTTPSEPPSAEEKARKAKEEAEKEVKRKAVAEALSKEAGYRSVAYLGKGRYMIDYAISGRLDHNFIYPFNSDAEIVFPFIAIELRQGGTVRVTAPAFAGTAMSSGGGMPGMPSQNDKIDGTFTLTTDADIVMHNNEDGPTAGPNGLKALSWRVTPLSKSGPTASLRLGR